MGRTKNPTVEITSDDVAEDARLTGEQKAERFYKALNAALYDVQKTGLVGHESAQNIAKYSRARMGDKTATAVFGQWINDKAMERVDFQTCMTVNAVVMNPPTVSKNPKLTEDERWMVRLSVLNLAYAKVLEEMSEAGMDDIAIGEIENTINDEDYTFPEHLTDRIVAVKDAAYVGTVDRGRKTKD